MDAHEHVVAIANVAHDHRDVHVARGTFESVNVEQAEGSRQRDANRLADVCRAGVRRGGDHLGDHVAAVYPDLFTGKLTRMGDGRSLWFVQPRSVEVRSEPLAPLGTGQVMIRTAMSGISGGTEMLAYRGELDPDVAVDETIGALGGTFRYPFRYGYSCVGVVEQSRADLHEGTLVFAFHPHQDRFVADAADVVPLGSADPRQATMFPLVETALQISLDAGPLLGEPVVLFGLGAVGTLTALLLQRAGARVLAVDTQPWRRDAAGDLGIDGDRTGGAARRAGIRRASRRGAARDRGVRQPGRAANRTRTAVARGCGPRRLLVRRQGCVAAARWRLPPPPADDPQHAGVDDPGAVERSLDPRAAARRRRRPARRTPTRRVGHPHVSVRSRRGRVRRDRRRSRRIDPRGVGVRRSACSKSAPPSSSLRSTSCRGSKAPKASSIRTTTASTSSSSARNSTTAGWCATSTCSRPRCSDIDSIVARQEPRSDPPRRRRRRHGRSVRALGARLPRRRDPRHRCANPGGARVGELDVVRWIQRPARLTCRREHRARRVVADPRIADPGDRRPPLPSPNGRGGRGTRRADRVHLDRPAQSLAAMRTAWCSSTASPHGRSRHGS